MFKKSEKLKDDLNGQRAAPSQNPESIGWTRNLKITYVPQLTLYLKNSLYLWKQVLEAGRFPLCLGDLLLVSVFAGSIDELTSGLPLRLRIWRVGLLGFVSLRSSGLRQRCDFWCIRITKLCLLSEFLYLREDFGVILSWTNLHCLLGLSCWRCLVGCQ